MEFTDLGWQISIGFGKLYGGKNGTKKVTFFVSISLTSEVEKWRS
jgi:hypothetical protein